MSRAENFTLAMAYLDRLFPYLPEYNDFNFSQTNLFAGANLTLDEHQGIAQVKSEMEILLLDRFHYGDKHSRSNLYFHLNDLGRLVKSKGGHSAYLLYLEEEKEKSFNKEKLSLEQLNLSVEDLRNKVLDYDETKRNARHSKIISIIALIVSALTLVLRWICNKPA